MIPSDLSERLRRVTWISILAVLWIHAFNGDPRYLLPSSTLESPSHWGTWLQFFFSNGVLRFVIPLLFFSSGLLFGNSEEPYSWKLYKRLKSLGLPFLIWNLLGIALVLTVNQIPGWAETIPTYLQKPSMGFLLQGLFWSPVNFPLWYLRDLFFFCLISPVFRWVFGKPTLGRLGLIGLGLAAVFEFQPLLISLEGLFCFGLGYYAGLRKAPASAGRPWTKTTLVLTLLGAGILTVLAVYAQEPWGMWVRQLVYRATQFFGAYAVWHLARPRTPGSGSPWLAPVSFYLFAGHEPLMNLVMEPLLKVLPRSEHSWLGDAWALGVYFILPLLMALALGGLGWWLRSRTPRLHQVLTGGR